MPKGVYTRRPRPPTDEDGLLCAGCGREFRLPPSQVRNRRFCSQACRSGPPTLRPCKACGVEFQTYPALLALGKGKFCSQPCYWAAKRTRRTPLADRFWPKVDKSGECWLWTGALNEHGYGLINRGGRGRSAIASHVGWEVASGGPVPDGMDVCHNCPGGDNPACVRNDDVGTYEVAGVLYERRGHLWLGTAAANAADMVAKGRSSAGERAGHAKLTDALVLYIREHGNAVSARALAEQTGVSERTVRNVLQGDTWRHLTSLTPASL